MFQISLATSHVEPGFVKYSNLKDHCAKQSAFCPRWAKASAAQRLAKAQWAMSYAMDAMSFHGSPVATREVLGRPQVPAQTSRILPVVLWHHVAPLSSFAQLPSRWHVQPPAANRKCWKLSNASNRIQKLHRIQKLGIQKLDVGFRN